MRASPDHIGAREEWVQPLRPPALGLDHGGDSCSPLRKSWNAAGLSFIKVRSGSGFDPTYLRSRRAVKQQVRRVSASAG